MTNNKYDNKYSKWFLISNGILAGIGLLITIISSAMMGSQSDAKNVMNIINYIGIVYLGDLLFGLGVAGLFCHGIAKCCCECCHMFYLVIGILDCIGLCFTTFFIFGITSTLDAYADPNNPQSVSDLTSVRDSILEKCGSTTVTDDCKDYIDYYKSFADTVNCCGFISNNDGMGVGTIYAGEACSKASSQTVEACAYTTASSAVSTVAVSLLVMLIVYIAMIIFGFYVYNKSGVNRKIVNTGYYVPAPSIPVNAPMVGTQPVYTSQPVNYPAQNITIQGQQQQQYVPPEQQQYIPPVQPNPAAYNPQAPQNGSYIPPAL